MKPKTLKFRANGDANSYALLDGDTGKWVLSLLANGEMHTPEQIAVLDRLSQGWNTAPEFAGLPLRKLDELITLGMRVNGVSLEVTQEDGTVKRAACTTGGMVLWWQPEQERVIAPSVRSVMQQALEAHEQALGFTGSREIDAILSASSSRLRKALAAPQPGFYKDLAGTSTADIGDTVALVVTQSIDDINVADMAAAQEPVVVTPIETLRYWLDAYSNPRGDEHFMGHGMVVHLLREYLAMLEGAAPAQPAELVAGLERCGFDDACDFCQSPEGGVFTRLNHNAEDCTEAEFYICGNCIHDALKRFTTWPAPQPTTPPAAQPAEPANRRAFEAAMRQWDHWKQYALELQERLVKFEGGSPMLLNAAQQAPDRLHLAAMDLARKQADRINELEHQLAGHQPLTAREIGVLDNMIEAQLVHAQRCDAIENRVMAEKQKGWDMRRVELLRKLKAAHSITPPAEQPAPASDTIAVNLMRLAGLDKHKARECAEIVMQVLAAAHAITPENAPTEAPGTPE
jgi:hypothetical protein